MTNPLFWWTLLALGSLYTFWRGGAPERVGMAILVIGSILSTLSLRAMPVRFHDVEMGVFIVDIVALLLFVGLALAADRYWPLWVAGLQLVGVASHVLRLADADVIPWAYAITQSLWGYPILLAMVIGAARHRKRLTTLGADRSWARFFGPPGRAMPPPGPTP
jgi:hypothetical protein